MHPTSSSEQKSFWLYFPCYISGLAGLLSSQFSIYNDMIKTEWKIRWNSVSSPLPLRNMSSENGWLISYLCGKKIEVKPLVNIK